MPNIDEDEFDDDEFDEDDPLDAPDAALLRLEREREEVPAPPFAGALAAARARPEGVFRQCPAVRGWERARMTACWWTDVLGRRHWYLEAELTSREEKEGLLEERHPLEWIAPPLSAGWLTRGGARRFVAVCDCGASGTPAELGWTGECCAPCHDRRLDGQTVEWRSKWPVGPERGASFLLTEDERLVLLRVDRTKRPAEVVLQALAPWRGAPLWERRLAVGEGTVQAQRGELAVVADYAGALTVFGLDDGVTRGGARSSDLDFLHQAVFAGPDRSLLVCLCHPRAASTEAHVYECGPDGRLGRLVNRIDFGLPSHQPAEVRRDGALVMGQRDGITVRDAGTGRVIESLRLPEGPGTAALTVGGDGTVFAISPPPGRLARWPPLAAALPVEQVGRRPQRSAPGAAALRLALSPDGRVLAGVTRKELVLWDAETLEELARFEPGAAFLPSLAFDGDGHLLAATDRGLAVWPWRELAGAR